MRVLLTLDAVGGVWHYGLDLARSLSARQVETVLAVLGPAPDASQRAEAHTIAGASLVETGLPLDWLCDGPAPVLAGGATLMQCAQDMGADVVQLNMPAMAAATQEAPLALPTIAVTHGCVSTWWEAAHPGQPLATDYHWHRDLTRAGLHAADLVVAPTASYAQVIARHYALPGIPRVVHNGRSHLPLAPRAMHDRLITVGRLWDRVKRADLLDRVAGRLTVQFDAAGKATGPHGEHRALRDLHLLGQLDSEALGSRLSSRPVFVSAASFEPFGLAVLEAAQAGCALVLSDIASFRELWDGVAVFVPGEDEAEWAAALDAIVGDVPLRERLGETARARAARYTPDAMADGMMALYAEALARRGSGSGRRVAA